MDINLWSTNAASNNSASPNGWNAGMLAGSVDDVGREMMAAVRRAYEISNPVVTSTGSANAYAVNFSVAPAALVDGQLYCWLSSFSNTGASTLNVNSLGAKPIVDLSGNPLVAGAIQSGMPVQVAYSASGAKFVLIDPAVISLSAGGTGATTAAAARTALGLGSAAIVNTGTSGATIPLLNAANTHSGQLTVTGGMIVSTGTMNVPSTFQLGGATVAAPANK